MRSNSVWGFIGLAVACGLARLAMIWTQGDEWIGPWLIAAATLSLAIAVILLLWPFLPRVFGLENATARGTAPLHNLHRAAAAIAQNGSTINQTYVTHGTTGPPHSAHSANISTTSPAPPVASRNTFSEALLIQFDPRDKKYIQDDIFADGTRRRSIVVRVKNVGNGWPTRCALQVLDIYPEPEERAPLNTIEGGFDLLFPTLDRPITLCGFNYVEGPPGQRQVLYNDRVVIFFSAPGAWNGGAYTSFLPDRPRVIRLRATSDDCSPYECDLRVWVADGRLLQGGPAIVGQSAD